MLRYAKQKDYIIDQVELMMDDGSTFTVSLMDMKKWSVFSLYAPNSMYWVKVSRYPLIHPLSLLFPYFLFVNSKRVLGDW